MYILPPFQNPNTLTIIFFSKSKYPYHHFISKSRHTLESKTPPHGKPSNPPKDGIARRSLSILSNPNTLRGELSLLGWILSPSSLPGAADAMYIYYFLGFERVLFCSRSQHSCSYSILGFERVLYCSRSLSSCSYSCSRAVN